MCVLEATTERMPPSFPGLTLQLPLLLLVIISSSGRGVRPFHLLVLLSQSILAQLLLRQELTFAPCVNHNIAYFAALALLLGATF